MATHSPGKDLTFSAGANLSALQFTGVKAAAALTGEDQMSVVGAGAGERCMGILQNKPNAAGLGAVVRLDGVSVMVVDGNVAAIAAGDPLITDAAGKGVKATADKAKVIAWALQASTAAGDQISVLVRPFDLAV